MSTVKAQHKPKLAPKGSGTKSGPVRVVKPASNSAKHEGATERLSPARKAKATHPCICGCGSETKRVFAPGHDAKVYAILRKVRDGEAKHQDIPAGVRQDEALLAHMLTHVS